MTDGCSVSFAIPFDELTVYAFLSASIISNPFQPRDRSMYKVLERNSIKNPFGYNPDITVRQTVGNLT